MRILIIDRDDMFSGLLASKMRAAGHDVVETRIKNDGLEQMISGKVDAVYFDPSPLNDPKAILYQVRRMVHNFPYLVLTGDFSRAQAIKAGCHDALRKPLDPEALTASLANGERMIGLIRRLGDESYDFPSSGGVISKSAFNQLFLSAMDRVGRYGENAHALFLSVSNYEQIKFDDGKYAADYAASRLAQMLVRLRRQSDILAQTGASEFALLLQRPQTDTESLDAARRFADSLDARSEIASGGMTDVKIEVSLVHIPTGALDFHQETVIPAIGARRNG